MRALKGLIIMLIDRMKNLLAGYDPASHDYLALVSAISVMQAAEALGTTVAVAEMEADPKWGKPEDPACRINPMNEFAEACMDSLCEGADTREQADDRIEALEAVCASRSELNVQLSTQLGKQQDAIKKLEDENKYLRDDIERLQGEIIEDRKEHTQEIVRLEREVGAAEQEIHSNQRQMDDMSCNEGQDWGMQP